MKSVLFSEFFFTLIGYLDQKLWWFKRTTSHFIKNHFYVFFQNAHHCNVRKNAVFKKIWGFVSEYVRTITYVYVFIKKLVLSWSSLRPPVFLKLDWCTLTAVMKMYRWHMFVDWWVVLIWAMLHELMCSNIYMHHPFVFFMPRC